MSKREVLLLEPTTDTLFYSTKFLLVRLLLIEDGRMEEWKNGRMEEWKNGRMEEWRDEMDMMSICVIRAGLADGVLKEDWLVQNMFR